jgi:diguanylate cyclase (GGDEF)-like protein
MVDNANTRRVLDEIVTGLAVADGPAFRGDLARVLDRDSETIRMAVETGLTDGLLYLTGDNRVALVDPPDEMTLEHQLSDRQLTELRHRWMRVHRFRSWAQQQVTRSSRTGVGVVFTDDIHILPNPALCRLVDDWSSPEMWFRDLLAHARMPDPRSCPNCGGGEIVGDSLVELEAPSGHKKTFSITFYGHCHEEKTSEPDQPPLLFAVRLRKERTSQPSAQPVLGGSASDTGLDLAVSFPDLDPQSDHTPGTQDLDNILATTERLHRQLTDLADSLDGAPPEPAAREALDKLVETSSALRDDVQYRRETMRLTSTVRTLRSIFDSNWTFEDVGRRTVAALETVFEADEILLLMHDEGEGYAVLGRTSGDETDDDRLPDAMSTRESTTLRRAISTDGLVEITDTTDHALDDDPLACGRSLMVVPLQTGTSPTGILVVARDTPGSFHRVDRQFLEALARPLADILDDLGSGSSFSGAAGIDEVTGVFNQTRFLGNAAREFVQARAEGRDLSALVFSIDDWDRISQSHNTNATDELLRSVVSRAAEALRGSDFVGRYAQATFAAILVGVDAEIAREVADRIRSTIADRPVHLGDAELPVTASVGAAETTPELNAADRLVSRADSAMMKASGDGGNRVEVAEGREMGT